MTTPMSTYRALASLTAASGLQTSPASKSHTPASSLSAPGSPTTPTPTTHPSARSDAVSGLPTHRAQNTRASQSNTGAVPTLPPPSSGSLATHRTAAAINFRDTHSYSGCHAGTGVTELTHRAHSITDGHAAPGAVPNLPPPSRRLTAMAKTAAAIIHPHAHASNASQIGFGVGTQPLRGEH